MIDWPPIDIDLASIIRLDLSSELKISMQFYAKPKRTEKIDCGAQVRDPSRNQGVTGIRLLMVSIDLCTVD